MISAQDAPPIDNRRGSVTVTRYQVILPKGPKMAPTPPDRMVPIALAVPGGIRAGNVNAVGLSDHGRVSRFAIVPSNETYESVRDLSIEPRLFSWNWFASGELPPHAVPNEKRSADHLCR